MLSKAQRNFCGNTSSGSLKKNSVQLYALLCATLGNLSSLKVQEGLQRNEIILPAYEGVSVHVFNLKSGLAPNPSGCLIQMSRRDLRFAFQVSLRCGIRFFDKI